MPGLLTIDKVLYAIILSKDKYYSFGRQKKERKYVTSFDHLFHGKEINISHFADGLKKERKINVTSFDHPVVKYPHFSLCKME